MKYTGIIMIVVGALILLLSYATDRFLNSGAVDHNWIQGLAMLLLLLLLSCFSHVQLCVTL